MNTLLLELLSFALFLFVVSSTYEGLTKFHKNLYNNTIAHQILLLAATELKDKLKLHKAALEKNENIQNFYWDFIILVYKFLTAIV